MATAVSCRAKINGFAHTSSLRHRQGRIGTVAATNDGRRYRKNRSRRSWRFVSGRGATRLIVRSERHCVSASYRHSRGRKLSKQIAICG
jgi:hypothetical protein